MINSRFQLPTPEVHECPAVWELGVGCLGVWSLALSVSSSASAQWPQWRGPGGHGISAEKNLPTEWSPATEDKPAVNIKWKTEIPGRGHSSPVVADNLVFVTTSIKGEHVPGRKAQVHLDFQNTPGYVHPDAVDIDYKHTLKVYAVDAKTGKVAWERIAYDGVMFDDRHRKNTFASSTMVTDGERAYAFFESAGSTPTTSRASWSGRRISARSSRPAWAPVRRPSFTRT